MNKEEKRVFGELSYAHGVKIAYARMRAEVEKARVDAYLEPLWEKFVAEVKPVSEFDSTPGPVTDRESLYLADVPTRDAWYDIRRVADAANGYTAWPKCPELVARAECIDVENDYIREFERIFEVEVTRAADRANVLKLILELVVEIDGVKKDK